MGDVLELFLTTNGTVISPLLLVCPRSAMYTPDTALAGTVQLKVVVQLPQSTRPVLDWLTHAGWLTAGKVCVGEVSMSLAPLPPYQPRRRISMLYGTGDLT